MCAAGISGHNVTHSVNARLLRSERFKTYHAIVMRRAADKV
jgi:hypothetical protein